MFKKIFCLIAGLASSGVMAAEGITCQALPGDGRIIRQSAGFNSQGTAEIRKAISNRFTVQAWTVRNSDGTYVLSGQG